MGKGARMGRMGAALALACGAAVAEPMPLAGDAALDRLALGRSFFSVPWVAAPSATTARDGLGPLFNANTCASCHVANGSARAIGAAGEPLRALLFKLARPGAHESRAEATSPDMPGHARVTDPAYGGQIAVLATGGLRAEARPRLERAAMPLRYPDGAEVTLERFTPHLDALSYGPLAPDTVVFTRQPPALAGLGLIEEVAEAEILAFADPDDANGDGISGRANRTGTGALGRYGWKAAEATLLAQTAAAAAHDMGLTNPLYPEELCQPGQTACRAAPRGRPSPEGALDLPEARLAAIVAYLSTIRAPEPRALDAQAQEGAALFAAVGCSACHRAKMVTAEGRALHPLSDYLLHDMGPALADGVREHLAEGAEFRTAPLWGLGGRIRAGHRFLHDARAATPEAAILWHGGEAAPARAAFVSLSPAARAAILHYLESL